MTPSKKPIINCHTHVFTGDYVPPYLAKTYIPAPLHFIFSLKFIVNILRWYYNTVKPLKYKNLYKWIKRQLYLCEMFFRRNYIFGVLKFFAELYVVIHLTFYIGIWILSLTLEYQNFALRLIQKGLIYLKSSGIIIIIDSTFVKILLFFLIFIFLKTGRNLILFLLKKVKLIPGKETTDLIKRYIQIGLYSRYKRQSGIYDKLVKQYPTDTQIVCLPMDMEFMSAGKLSSGFNLESQMSELLMIKQKNPKTFHPFVFAEPRRFVKDKSYFDYSVGDNGEVLLKDNCFIKQYLVDNKFSGIKIYPALGYYPFDEALLPLWKYASDNSIPIMTHCIRGTIFYRGEKEKSWDKHPYFTEGKIKNNEAVSFELDLESDYIEEDKMKSLYLNEIRNIDFCNNFTNPLNYLCLLNKDVLTKVVKAAKDPRIKELFGYDEAKDSISHNLEDLKLCFAHFGGDDQWKKFLESDRDNYTSQLILNPNHGIDFFKSTSGVERPGKLAYIWKYVDWYTIICSIILQYKNIYADISYILHDDIILPLLKQTLSNPKLRDKVLYGSDFYVVRNHKSDKDILAHMRAGLTEDEFDQIARNNPEKFLKRYL